MNLYKRIFEDGNFSRNPFPHWVVENFFDPEDLEIICKYFPASQQICKSLRDDVKFLVNNENVSDIDDAKKAALGRLGFRLKNSKFDYETSRRLLDNGRAFAYKPGTSYPLQMGECCTPIQLKYSESVEFDNIIRRLELDWWDLRRKIVQQVKQITKYQIPDNLEFISRGDIRAASPSTRSDMTTLGPHVDSEMELFAGLIYLRNPLDTSKGSDLVMYELKDDCPKQFMSNKRRIPLKYLNPVKTIEYRLNNAVFFINSPLSVHSVSVRSASRFDRRNINLSIECSDSNQHAVFTKKDYVSDELSSQKKYGLYKNVEETIL